jgi:hypothetical protein
MVHKIFKGPPVPSQFNFETASFFGHTLHKKIPQPGKQETVSIREILTFYVLLVCAQVVD